MKIKHPEGLKDSIKHELYMRFGQENTEDIAQYVVNQLEHLPEDGLEDEIALEQDGVYLVIHKRFKNIAAKERIVENLASYLGFSEGFSDEKSYLIACHLVYDIEQFYTDEPAENRPGLIDQENHDILN